MPALQQARWSELGFGTACRHGGRIAEYRGRELNKLASRPLEGTAQLTESEHHPTVACHAKQPTMPNTDNNECE